MVAVTAPYRRGPRAEGRRGVLLLVVLSMLTLFVMLGSTYLVVTMRARRVSQAFASKVTAPAAAGPTGEMLVDAALLTVLRGAAAVTPPPTPPTTGLQWLQSGEDLLGDMYGAETLIGDITDVSSYAASPAFLQLSTANLVGPLSDVTQLHGRVVTIKLPGLVASTRILKATGATTAPTIVIAAGPTVTGTPLSLAVLRGTLVNALTATGFINGTAGSIVINGREFAGTAGGASANEPWDAFDPKNPLLTRIVPNPSAGPSAGAPQVTAAPLLTMVTTPPPIDVDSDSDGVSDTGWIDIGLPSFTDASGRSVQPKAAILVVDLDGRINLNTHGDPTTFDTFSTAFTPALTDARGGDTAYPRYYSVNEIPGNGMDDDMNGVADDQYCWTLPSGSPRSFMRALSPGPGLVVATSLQKSDAFRRTIVSGARGGTSAHADIATDMLHAIGGLTAAANTTAHTRFDLRAGTRPIPNVGGPEGRYGSGGGWSGTLDPDQLPRPGRRRFNDQLTETRERWTVELIASGSYARSFFDNPGRYGTPPDLKGRMATWADPQTGQTVFYKPYWDESARGFPFDNEAVDDPYEVDLTPVGSRIAAVRNPGSSGNDVNNPYTSADLEGLLRFFDPDSPRLSRRLVVTNDRVSSITRMTVTTESWDSTAITGNAWEQVIRSNFTTLLASGSVNDFFAPETTVGHRLDLNRPFHDTNPTEPYFDDLNGNGVFDSGEPRLGEQRRQQFAKHLYCLLGAIAARNGLTMPMAADQARRLAQYAVNIVDFRDADSTMTLFRFDPAFVPGTTSWTPGPNDFVWGCERPEVLITETLAWHDRNTDDESVGGSVRVPVGQPQHDTSFDQQRRPRGAFFVELTSPWGAPAYEFDAPNTTIRPKAVSAGSRNPFDHYRADLLAEDLVSTEDGNSNGMLDPGEDANGNGRLDPGEDANGDGLLDPGEDRNGNGVLDHPARRNRLNTGIDLGKTVSTTGDPVWRMVSVRGEVNGGTAFGTDPISDATSNASRSIIDPAMPGGTATIDRAFYFTATPPPGLLLNQPVGGVFWQGAPSATPLTRGQFYVVGTNAPLIPDLATPSRIPAPGNVAGMIGPGNKPATLTEPLINSAADPYHAIMLEIQPAAMMTPDPALGGIAASWNTAIPEPLDAYGPSGRQFPPAAGIVSTAFTNSANQPILMINGTHENFAVIHLQRLADPRRPWDDVPASSSYNPYVTVDVMPVDLNVVNSVNMKLADTPVPLTAALPDGNHDDPMTGAARAYGSISNPMLSTQRGGYGGSSNESDIWSRRVRAAVSDVRDANAFLSEPVVAVPPNDLTAMAIPDRPLPPAPRHTLDGQITGFRILSGGSGYTSSPTVTVTGGGGGGLTPRAIVDNGSVVAIEVTNGGSGYRDPGLLTVSLNGGSGSGASARPLVGGKPTRWNRPYASLFWPNRPFENAVELSLVPVTAPFHFTQRHSIDAPAIPSDQRFFHLAGFWETDAPPNPSMSQWVWRYVTGRFDAPLTPPSPGPFNLLEFVQVRSRFANLYRTVPTGGANTTALQNLGLDETPSEHLSSWREPGRINMNTIIDGEGPGGESRGAWRAIFGAMDSQDDAYSPGGSDDWLPRWDAALFHTAAPAPPATPSTYNAVTQLGDVFRKLPDRHDPANVVDPPIAASRRGGFLDDHTDAMNDRVRQTDRHAWSRYQTMLNLSDRVTTRSNAYAVWVTIGYFDPGTTNEVSPAQRNRGFFIIDRSIPVAYERGKDHNVRDAIRLRRIIQ